MFHCFPIHCYWENFFFGVTPRMGIVTPRKMSFPSLSPIAMVVDVVYVAVGEGTVGIVCWEVCSHWAHWQLAD